MEKLKRSDIFEYNSGWATVEIAEKEILNVYPKDIHQQQCVLIEPFTNSIPIFTPSQLRQYTLHIDYKNTNE